MDIIRTLKHVVSTGDISFLATQDMKFIQREFKSKILKS